MKTQAQTILGLLQAGSTISTLKASKMGIRDLQTVIYRLRRSGWPIHGHWMKGKRRYKVYFWYDKKN